MTQEKMTVQVSADFSPVFDGMKAVALELSKLSDAWYDSVDRLVAWAVENSGVVDSSDDYTITKVEA